MSSRVVPTPFPGSQAFVGIMSVLTGYLSTRTAITLTNQALTELGLTPETMGRTDVKSVVDIMRPGLRVFCNEGDLERILAGLAAVESGSGASEMVAANRAQRARQVTVRLPRGGEHE